MFIALTQQDLYIIYCFKWEECVADPDLLQAMLRMVQESHLVAPTDLIFSRSQAYMEQDSLVQALYQAHHSNQLRFPRHHYLPLSLLLEDLVMASRNPTLTIPPDPDSDYHRFCLIIYSSPRLPLLRTCAHDFSVIG
jgi:hypothetical protein